MTTRQRAALDVVRLAVAVVLVAAAPAGAQPDSLAAAADAFVDAPMTLEEIRVSRHEADVHVDFRIAALLDREAAEHLERGVPATVAVDVELWRSRGIWFDHLESSAHVISRIQYDVWDEVYAVDRLADETQTSSRLTTLAAVRDLVSEAQSVPIIAFDAIRADKEYYLVVSATLQPLTLDDVDELEDWLSGGIKSGRSRGFGLLGFPKQLFKVVLNLTGLRDRTDRMRSERFGKIDILAGRALGRE